MRWLNRLAAVLSFAVTAMSVLLILVLAGGAAVGTGTRPGFVWGFGVWFGQQGAGLAWPLFAWIAAGTLALLALAGFRAELRTRRRGSAVLLGAVALHAAWLIGIRPPAERTGVFTGTFSYGHYGIRPDLLVPCQDSTGPLPRGPELSMGPDEIDPLPVMVAVQVPEDGWKGSHPDRWPHTRSDVHGTQYWLVRLRGTMIGPGHYGWPPVMHYRLQVDSVVSVRPTRVFADECGVQDPPPDLSSLD